MRATSRSCGAVGCEPSAVSRQRCPRSTRAGGATARAAPPTRCRRRAAPARPRPAAGSCRGARCRSRRRSRARRRPAARRERVPARGERGRLGRGDERRLGGRRRRVALARARSGDRLRQRLPRSMRSTRIPSTVVMIVEPPGEPTPSHGRPSRRTIVGAIELRGRLPPSTRLGCVSEVKLKSVSSLLSRKPWPGTTSPEPPVDSIVNVYDDDVAVLVGHGEVRRRARARRRRRRLAGTRARAVVERMRITGRDRARRGRLADQRASRRGEVLGDQPGERDVEELVEVRVGDVGAAVGEREARRPPARDAARRRASSSARS